MIETYNIKCVVIASVAYIQCICKMNAQSKFLLCTSFSLLKGKKINFKGDLTVEYVMLQITCTHAGFEISSCP
jgi:hypothetical protein